MLPIQLRRPVAVALILTAIALSACEDDPDPAVVDATTQDTSSETGDSNRDTDAPDCSLVSCGQVEAGAPEVAPEVAAETAACPACASDEICVQLNDSSTQCQSATPTLRCRRVSSACRAELPLISTTNRSCQQVSAACQQELCSAPYQCTYTPPCGNESAAAQAWCYGP